MVQLAEFRDSGKVELEPGGVRGVPAAIKKKGAKVKVSVTQTKARGTAVKKYVGLRYESSNTNVATVSKKGVIKAKAKGKATIVVYAQDGVSKMVKVTVR